MPEMTYGEAVNAALRKALTEWPETILFGEDVAKPGGVFGVTRRLHRDFGARVFDTPISESAMVGAAVGAAMLGCRPIVEIMWSDFMLVAMDQVINQAANVRYVSNGEMAAPLTIRTQQGSTPGSCAQHSQSLEAILAHIPGLRVCMPSTPQDAYDLLLSSIACEDPTIVIEARGLYNGPRQSVDTEKPVQAIGGTRHRASGDDLTIVTWGAQTHQVLDAAQRLNADGITVDIIEAVWLNPLDADSIRRSLQRTGRLLVVHEANVTGGFGAEVLARVSEIGVPLRSPAKRIGLPDLRMPAAPVLSAAVLPSADTITQAGRDVVAAKQPPALAT